MTVLIVDDQIHVVSGLISGIQWEKIGIHKVLKAYNAQEAKDRLERFDIDIVLCDIEMPVESGLSLCAWSKEQGFHAEFVFLTAHADFLYAKEAIRLGGFDYVLQPARYEDVEQVIQRAKEHVEVQRRVSAMEYCSDTFQKQRETLLDGSFFAWLSGNFADWGQLRRNLNNLGVDLQEDAGVWCCLIQICEKSSILQSWEENLIAYVYYNIMQELLHPYACSCLCRPVTEGEYVLLLYTKREGHIVAESLDCQLERMRQQFLKYYRQDFACYIMQCQKPELLSETYETLEEIKRENVEMITGIFWNSRKVRGTLEDMQLSKISMEWESLLENRLYDSFAEAAVEQLHRMCRNEKMNAETLNRFYQEFMRVVYLSANAGGYTAKDIFQKRQDLENACSAYTSVKRMEWLIEYVHAFFNEIGVSDEQRSTQIDSILQYIRTHLDKNIRRTDVAEAVHLNPNYVSRLFKNTVGISLKEYILQEKMNLAAKFIRETELPVSAVAMKVGYTNFSLFTQTYKKMCGGLTPAEDRKQYRIKRV